MRDTLKEWCDTTEISIEHINHLACDAAEHFIEVDTAYISPDLFAQLLKEMSNIAKYNIPSFNQNSFNAVQIMTVIGPVTVKVVSGLINFCHVGNESTYNRLEWIRVGEAFEKEILSD